MTRVNMNQIDLGAGLYQSKKNSKLHSHAYNEASTAGPVLPTLSNVTQSQAMGSMKKSNGYVRTKVYRPQFIDNRKSPDFCKPEELIEQASKQKKQKEVQYILEAFRNSLNEA